MQKCPPIAVGILWNNKCKICLSYASGSPLVGMGRHKNKFSSQQEGNSKTFGVCDGAHMLLHITLFVFTLNS